MDKGKGLRVYSLLQVGECKYFSVDFTHYLPWQACSIMCLSQTPGGHIPVWIHFDALLPLTIAIIIAFSAYRQVPLLQLGEVKQWLIEDLLDASMPWGELELGTSGSAVWRFNRLVMAPTIFII